MDFHKIYDSLVSTWSYLNLLPDLCCTPCVNYFDVCIVCVQPTETNFNFSSMLQNTQIEMMTAVLVPTTLKNFFTINVDFACLAILPTIFISFHQIASNLHGCKYDAKS